MKEILKLGGILLLITAICAGLLGLINNITKPLIATSKEKATKDAIQKILPEAEEVVRLEHMEEAWVMELYIAKQQGDYIGSVVKVDPNGYGGAIEMLVGVHKDGTVAGIQILTHAETPGLGANMTKESFTDQFKGKQAQIGVVKGSASGNNIEAITGATITSQAVAEGVNDVVEYIKINQEVLMKEGNE